MHYALPDFTKSRIMVIGDVMLDQYWHGDCERLSPEAPVPVVKVNNWHASPGGAGNAARNLTSLGAGATLFSVIGQDQQAETLKGLLTQQGVRYRMQADQTAPTIAKLRVLGSHQQLLRADFEQAFDEVSYQALADDVLQEMSAYQAVLISDYGKGVNQIIPQIINHARQLQIPVFVDPKSEDFHCYQGATLITPNRKEFQQVAGRCENQQQLEARGFDLIERYDLLGLLVTQGPEGMTLLIKGNPPVHYPTQAREVYDVTGAGDTVISVLAAASAAGSSWTDSSQLANLAAGQVVGKLGSSTISWLDLRQALQSNADSTYGIASVESLKNIVKESQHNGERVVMTNGCFDLLHEGHVRYLEEAKKLGHRLVVAVNDDDSVARLKGPGRPIKTLTERMVLLSALHAVDWVVSFSDYTPQNVIEALGPDVLVKGGDYNVEDIAGAEHVIANGGEVRLLNYYEGYSTSTTIQSIREYEV